MAAAIFFRPVWWVIPLGPSGGLALFSPSGFGTEPALLPGINPIKLYSTVRYHLQMIYLIIFILFLFVVAAAIFFRPVWWVIPLGPSGGLALFSPSGFGTEPALLPGINPIKLYSTVRYHLQMIYLIIFILFSGIYMAARVFNHIYPREGRNMALAFSIFLPSDLILPAERLFISNNLWRLIIVVQE